MDQDWVDVQVSVCVCVCTRARVMTSNRALTPLVAESRLSKGKHGDSDDKGPGSDPEGIVVHAAKHVIWQSDSF